MWQRHRLQAVLMVISIVNSALIGYGDHVARWSGWSRNTIRGLVILLLIIMAGLALVIWRSDDGYGLEAIRPIIGKPQRLVFTGVIISLLFLLVLMFMLYEVFPIARPWAGLLAASITAAIVFGPILYLLWNQRR
jgi:uncharacterized membrane protein YbhN (UPF0104 family)